MEQVYSQLEALGKSERRVAMATLIGTRGATPKKEGAKMWVGADGQVRGSVTIGGCVDAKVIAEAETVLSAGAARRLSMALGDEDAWEIGLSCGGTVELLVEPLDLEGALVRMYRRIAGEIEQGRAACLVRSLRDPAQSLLLLQGGESEGTLGTPELDRAAREIAFARGASRSETIAGEEAFFELHTPRPHLVLVGAGHISMPLVPLARTLGFRTTVIDARPRFANRERFPEVDEIKVGIASEIIGQIRLVPSTAVVLTVHDYKVEVPVLKAALASSAGYVGMLGNKRRGKAVLEMLREQGLSEEQLARVHVPLGLDIGAQSAAEIALSALGQIIAERGRGRE
ncbi:MAG: XdhC family protein [Deltaproteobacteria bacterium]|nr:MAG: XdhC family protein [Deltaproteobacteria bacterium]